MLHGNSYFFKPQLNATTRLALAKKRDAKEQQGTNQIVNTKAVVLRNCLQNCPGFQITHTQTSLHIQPQADFFSLQS
jgi:hypothetical protein